MNSYPTMNCYAELRFLDKTLLVQVLNIEYGLITFCYKQPSGEIVSNSVSSQYIADPLSNIELCDIRRNLYPSGWTKTIPPKMSKPLEELLEELYSKEMEILSEINKRNDIQQKIIKTIEEENKQ